MAYGDRIQDISIDIYGRSDGKNILYDSNLYIRGGRIYGGRINNNFATILRYQLSNISSSPQEYFSNSAFTGSNAYKVTILDGGFYYFYDRSNDQFDKYNASDENEDPTSFSEPIDLNNLEDIKSDNNYFYLLSPSYIWYEVEDVLENGLFQYSKLIASGGNSKIRVFRKDGTRGATEMALDIDLPPLMYVTSFDIWNDMFYITTYPAVSGEHHVDVNDNPIPMLSPKIRVFQKDGTRGATEMALDIDLPRLIEGNVGYSLSTSVFILHGGSDQRMAISDNVCYVTYGSGSGTVLYGFDLTIPSGPSIFLGTKRQDVYIGGTKHDVYIGDKKL